MGLAVDGLSPPQVVGSVGRSVGTVVPYDPPDGRHEPRDVRVAEIHEARVRLADQVHEAHLPRTVQKRSGGRGGSLATGLGASTHVRMLDHIDVISNEAHRAGRPDGNGFRRYGTMSALVPMGTRGYRSSESEIVIRMQPCDAYVPTELVE